MRSLSDTTCAYAGVRSKDGASLGSLRILGPRSLYPVPWPSWRSLVDPGRAEAALEELKGAVAVHLWNELSGGKEEFAPEGSAMEAVARDNCPVALQRARKEKKATEGRHQ